MMTVLVDLLRKSNRFCTTPPESRRSTMSKRRLACLLVAVALPAVNALAAPLPVDSVTISAAGLAVLTHPFTASSTNTNLSLPVRQRDINDVLKTLVVLSPDATLGSMRLAGNDPLALPVAPDQMQTLPDLLQALRGEILNISGPRALTGRIASITPQPATETQPLRHRVTLLGEDGGLQTFVLEDATQLRFVDARLNQALMQALNKAAGQQPNAVYDLKVQLQLSGADTASGQLAYLLAMPLWKTAYRLVLEPEGKTGTLQAMAVIENSSPLDWNAVRLTLLTGSPVTFSQDLYGSHYRDRPELALPETASAVPEADRGAVAMMDQSAAAAPRAETLKAMAAPGRAMAAPAPAPATSAEETPFAARYTFQHPVSIAAGTVAAVPFTTARVPAERLAFYQPATHATHPYTAVQVENASAASLPPGILTVYARGKTGPDYLGDAELTAFGKGESRLLPFALDQKIRIVAEPKQTESLSRVVWADGLLKATITERQITTYRIASAHDDAVTLLIAQPREAGLTLRTPKEGVEITESSWRFRVPLAANTDQTLQVVATRPVAREYSFTSGDIGWPELRQLYILLQGTENLPDLTAIENTFRAISGVEKELHALAMQKNSLYAEQERLRQNLQAVGNDSDLGRRYRNSLGQQEDQLSRIAQDSDSAHTRRQQLVQQLGQQLAAVKWPEE